MLDVHQYLVGSAHASTSDCKSVLSVYVDDFKMAGKQVNLAAAWTLIQSQIRLDNPTEIGKYLGCTHTIGTISISTAHSINEWRSDTLNQALADLGHPNHEKPPPSVKTMAYDMRDFVGQCVERYCELANIS